MWAAFGAWCDRRMAYGNEHGWPGGMPVLLEQHMAVCRKLYELAGARRPGALLVEHNRSNPRSPPVEHRYPKVDDRGRMLS
jgi:hypothetical protein